MADERQHKLRKYKAYLEAHPDSKEKVLQVFKKLLTFPVTFELLKETGIGKTVNGFRKEEGEIGLQARAIVSGWKNLVAHGNATEQADTSPPAPQAEDNSPKEGLQEQQTEKSSRPSHSPSPTPSKSAGSSRSAEKSSSSKSGHSSHHHSSHKGEEGKQPSSSSSSRHERSGSSARSDSTHKKVESVKADVLNGEVTKSKASSSLGSSKQGSRDSEKHRDGSELSGSHGASKPETKDSVKHRDKSEKKESSSHAHSKSATSSSSDAKKDKSATSSSSDAKKDKSASSSTSSSDKHKSHSSSNHHHHHHHSSSKDGKHSEKSQSSHKSPSKDAKKDAVEKGSSEKHKHSDHQKSKSSHSSSSHKSASSSSKPSSKDDGSRSRKRKSEDKESGRPSKKQLIDTASAVINDNTNALSFEDLMSFDVAAAVAATKKKPVTSVSKKSPVASTSKASSSKAGSSSSSSSSSKGTLSKPSSSKRQLPEPDLALEVPLPPPKQMKFDIMSSLPETQADYRPLPFYSLPEDKRKMTVADVDPMQIGTKTKSARMLYSGRKHGITEVKRLFDLSMQCLFENIDSLEEVGGVPFDILKPVLERCTAHQLYRIEDCNPHLAMDEGSNELWKRHCERDFRNKMNQREELESWKDLYVRLLEEREAKFEALKANMSASVSRVSNEKRKTQLAYVDTVAKAPRNIRQKQLRFGTFKVGQTGEDVKTGPVKTGFTRAKNPVKTAPTPAAPKQVKLVAPMMQKTLKMMKKLRR